jgi:hypothetical protein
MSGLLVLDAGAAWAQSLVAAVLPTSRAVQVGTPATAFVTIINTGTVTANSVSVALPPGLPATFGYQTTDPATNLPVGQPNTPANIGPGQSQSYVVAITPQAPIPPTDVALIYSGTNTGAVAPIVGVNTLLLFASATPTPDLIALAATPSGDGILNIPGVTGSTAFAVASSNVGAGGLVTVSADTGAATVPVTVAVCQTNPQTGSCLAAPTSTLTAQIDGGATSTFSVFVTGNAFVPLEPAANRVFVRFRDAQGVTTGSTSVAVRTSLVGNYQGSGSATLSACRLPSNNGTFQGSFTASVTGQTGNTISGTFTLTSDSVVTQVPFSATLTPLGNIPATAVSFTVSVAGLPVGSGTATLTGQVTDNTVAASFSGQLQGLEICAVQGSGTATRL